MKMESDREIESSKTEMETDEETFERDAPAVSEDCLVKKQNAKAAVMAVFRVRNGVGHGQRPKSAVMPSLSCTHKNKACQYQQLVQLTISHN